MLLIFQAFFEKQKKNPQQLQNQHPSMTTIEKLNIKFKIILWFVTVSDVSYLQYDTYFITHMLHTLPLCYIFV